MGKHRIARIAAFALAVVGLQLPGAASADTASEGSREHCVAALAESGSADGDSAVLDFRCFDSFEESLEYDDGAQTRSSTAQAYTLLGVLYDYNDYGAPTLALYGNSGSCASGANYGFPRLAAYGWNNRAGSAKGHNGCAITFYLDPYYGGSTKSCFNSCWTLRALNNDASSVYFW